MAIRLILADDQEVIRKGLVCVLADQDMQIVAQASTCQEAIDATKANKPDVLLLDVLMPDMDGLDALELIRKEVPATNVVMISAHDNLSYVARAVALGAQDFLLKDVAPDVFRSTIRRVVGGEPAPPDTTFSTIKARLQQRADPKADDVPLTRREYQVLKHLSFGLSNREIGYSMKISVETVKEHVQNVLRKLNMPDRTAAAVWLVKREIG